MTGQTVSYFVTVISGSNSFDPFISCNYLRLTSQALGPWFIKKKKKFLLLAGLPLGDTGARVSWGGLGNVTAQLGGHGAGWWTCGWVPPPDLPYSFTPCGWVVPGHVYELQNRQFSPSDHRTVVFLYTMCRTRLWFVPQYCEEIMKGTTTGLTQPRPLALHCHRSSCFISGADLALPLWVAFPSCCRRTTFPF